MHQHIVIVSSQLSLPNHKIEGFPTQLTSFPAHTCHHHIITIMIIINLIIKWRASTRSGPPSQQSTQPSSSLALTLCSK